LRNIEYKKRVRHAFDKRIIPWQFQPRELVLRKIEATGKKVAKLDPAWEGPFRVIRSYENRAYKLEEMDGIEVPRTWNVEHLRRFYR
jgi:hypothetical protein